MTLPRLLVIPAAILTLLASSALVLAAPATPTATTAQAAAPLNAQAVLSLMERVADWQIANPSKHRESDWTQGVGDNGIMALAGISGERKYRDAMIAMGARNGWSLGPNRYHADDHIVGQTYAELYLQLRDPKMIAPMRAQFDDILANPHEGPLLFTVPGNQDRWSWCDALFMAPPAFARLTAATGDQRYLDMAIAHWWRTSDYLYDKEEHLYFRDSNYFDKREANGKKVYWSRGNGWVMGGLVRMLQYLPADHPARPRFEQQFKEMAAKLITLQQDDGMWRASLLDPASYPMKETSGTGLYTYAFAWGVNQGLLDRARFGPAVRKGWDALVVNVQADGKLTHVQPIGLAPRAFDDNATEVYGVGAFLLAGSEVYRMAVLDKATPQLLTVRNPGDFARADETVEMAQAGSATVVMDAATSRIVNSQRIGQDLLFQATLAPHETRRYFVLPRAAVAAVPPADIKVHARFVPERLDDFAWESDRTAHRVYGTAIMSDPKEKLVSSGVDVWVKSVRTPIIDKWYKDGHYHQDKGEGLDFYDVGSARGCGGVGIVDGDKLATSINFQSWKVITDGPLRAEFELSFPAWNAAGRSVTETRRVSIDAGSNFSRIDDRFDAAGKGALPVAVGIMQRKGEGRFMSDAASGAMSYWEPRHGAEGNIACSVIVPGASGFADRGGHYLALANAQPGKALRYYTGAGWSKSGDFPTPEVWEAYVRGYAARMATPLAVSVVHPK